MYRRQNLAHDVLVKKLFENNSQLRLALAKSRAKNSMLEQQPLLNCSDSDTHHIEF